MKKEKIMKNLKDRIEKELKEAGANYQVIPLPKNLPIDIESHMKFHGKSMKYALATMVYKTEKGFVATQRRGDTKVSSKKLRELLNVKRLRLADEDEIKSLGFTSGLVPPLALGIPLYIDQQITQLDEIYGGLGHPEYAFKANVNDLIKASSGKIGYFAIADERFTIKRILSGITPSGDSLHIGNYFGAVKPQIDLQNQGDEVYYFIADLHALTTIKNKAQLENNITGVVLDYLALGLDPDKCVFFRQSQVPAHSLLAVVLANYIGYGQMKRMHAFKDKLQAGENIDSINMGLFNYPILMAADILLYKPYGVPVGEDQRQHIELTRDIAEAFNKTYNSEVFPLPEAMISKQTGKVVGTDGNRKMSKSLGNIISIFDDDTVIKKQIMGSYTDPKRLRATDPGTVEGNPIFVYHELINDNKKEVDELKARYEKGKVGDVEVKEKLFLAHQRLFYKAREKRKELESDSQKVKEILANGSKKAGQLANQTLQEVYQTIGIENKLN